ncbi:MAG: carboxypeptidase regulatory-like domain-containing protein, partial [Bacteroidales bacterium]|nr:carboxypeptidase regulatory-like domain-containing protein [Bacteroidales bacterium]
QNFSGLDLNNLQLEVLSGPPGCDVNFTPVANLPGNSLATMSYSITANEITIGSQYEEVKLQLTSSEGTKYRFSAWFYSRATMGNLKLNPVSLNKTMVSGAINYAEFQVTNNGLDSTGVISVLLPQNNWMSLANNNSTIASLAPGQSAVVTLKLIPGNDLQLNNPITGQIALSGTNSNSVGLPFSFEPVSLETGNFLVDVVDEYTYNTEAAPHLEGATVVFSHPYTGQIIRQGTTDANGHFLAEDINEGYYNLRVSAPQHANYQNLIYVEKAVTTTQVVFIAFQAITYSWQVVPTTIEDEYEITLVAVFETNVPAPVVTMSMPDTIPQLNFGEVFPFILVMTNHGLITAQDVVVEFPEDDEYEFIANVNMLDILPQSAVQIPVIVQRRDPNKSSGRSSNCSDFAIGSYKFECGPDDQLRLVMATVYYKGRYCGGTGGPGGPGGGWCWWCGGGGPGGPGGPGGGGIVDPIEIPTVPYQQSNVGCDPCLAEFLNALWSCSPIPNIGIGGAQIGLDGKLSDAWAIIKPLKDLLKKLKCAWNIGWSIGCKINNTFFNKSVGKEGPPELVQAEEDMYYVDKGFAATENIALEIYQNELLMERESFGIFNDSVFYNLENQIAVDAIRQAELLNTFADSDIPPSEIQGFFSRWNTSMEAWDLGFYSPTPDYPNIIDTLLLYNYTLSYDTALNYAIGRGYSSIEALYNAAYEIVAGYTEEESSAVCATVTVQFSQQLTMTREAFEGTLTIFNGHDTDAMENILLDLEIKDEEGFIRNDLFQINTQSLNQITGIDGSGVLDAQVEGTAVILFIPERGAAPDVPRYYSFGGTLSYLDPFTGEIFEQPLFPVTLQVNPSPDLYIDYFMQRDIYGDDALTEPIEPMIPAELAVMIDNRGAGTAFSVNIESAQPEIIENEKGLLIDFNIVGSSLSGQPTQLGLLNVDFGDIPGGDIRVGQWWFTSTLLGHFISYEVSVNHLSSYGNPDLSLISEVNVHELIKGVRVYGPLDDSIGDFLVNDIPDTDDIPDALYYSSGIVAPVYQANSATVDGPVSLNDLEIELTVTPFVTGWNYIKINDPGN